MNEEELGRRFHEHQEAVNKEENKYAVATEGLGISDRLKILQDRGQEDLIHLFKEWKPQANARRRKGAPLDQRVSITVSSEDRAIMDGEVKAIKASGEPASLGNLIRSRGMGSLDVTSWQEAASGALDELNELVKNQKEIEAERKSIELYLEGDLEEEDQNHYQRKAYQVKQKLDKLKPQSKGKRNIRIQGRMTYAEAEQVKWRANRLCLSTTDYLRFMIFGLEPNTIADAHLPVDARRRFYVSILDVAENGWGNPPGVYACSQCESYSDEITRLRKQVRALESENRN